MYDITVLSRLSPMIFLILLNWSATGWLVSSISGFVLKFKVRRTFNQRDTKIFRYNIKKILVFLQTRLHFISLTWKCRLIKGTYIICEQTQHNKSHETNLFLIFYLSVLLEHFALGFFDNNTMLQTKISYDNHEI